MELQRRRLKQGDNKTIEHLDVHPTNVRLKCGYHTDQLDNHKVGISFQIIKYFNIKQFIDEQDLSLN